MNSIRRIILALSLCALFLQSAHAQSAKETWENLVGEKMRARPEFAFVETFPSLPNVLIYGDSISMGYTPHVREQLKGKANVHRIHTNGSDSGKVIPNMKAMQSAMAAHWNFKWAVIHINTGLHDIKYVDENGQLNTKRGRQVHTPEQYQQNLRDVFSYLRSIAPDAHIIFATTTAVPEKSNGRKAGDEVKYNQAALTVVKEFPAITVNDLHTPTKKNHPAWNVRPNNVHFKTPGNRALGAQVASSILNALPKTP